MPGAVFSCVRPTPWTTPPALVAHSQEALALLDLDPAVTETTAFADWVAGNLVLEGSVPMAHRCGVCQCRQASPAPLIFRYGGYQFGYWADQLGDGRAHLLGEWVT